MGWRQGGNQLGELGGRRGRLRIGLPAVSSRRGVTAAKRPNSSRVLSRRVRALQLRKLRLELLHPPLPDLVHRPLRLLELLSERVALDGPLALLRLELCQKLALAGSPARALPLHLLLRPRVRAVEIREACRRELLRDFCRRARLGELRLVRLAPRVRLRARVVQLSVARGERGLELGGALLRGGDALPCDREARAHLLGERVRARPPVRGVILLQGHRAPRVFLLTAVFIGFGLHPRECLYDAVERVRGRYLGLR